MSNLCLKKYSWTYFIISYKELTFFLYIFF